MTAVPARRRATLAALLVALALGVPGCAGPPLAEVATPYGDVHAESQEQANHLAALLLRLHPGVGRLLPDSLDRDTDVWLADFSRDPQLADRPGVVGFTSVRGAEIRIRADRLGQDADFVLAHELVHALLGPSWDPLPAILKEGLCDALAARLAPESAARVRGIRLFEAGRAWPALELELSTFDPGLRRRRKLAVPLAAGGVGPVTALQRPGAGIHLHDGWDDEDALYGYGLLVAERILDRVGVVGLHELCKQATAVGEETVPAAWLLSTAELDERPSTWARAIREATGEAELLAQGAYLAPQLAPWIVATFRQRMPGRDGQEFLDEALPTLGWVGGSRMVALATVEPLRQALVDHWAATGPSILRPGEGFWIQDGDGVHLTSVLEPAPGEGVFTISRVGLGEPPVDGLPDASDARVEAVVELGEDAAGVFVRSALPDGFDAFRVEFDGELVADLSRGDAGLSVGRDEQGWVTIECRLPWLKGLRSLVLFDPRADLVIAQRAAGAGARGTTTFPLRVVTR